MPEQRVYGGMHEDGGLVLQRSLGLASVDPMWSTMLSESATSGKMCLLTRFSMTVNPLQSLAVDEANFVRGDPYNSSIDLMQFEDIVEPGTFEISSCPPESGKSCDERTGNMCQGVQKQSVKDCPPEEQPHSIHPVQGRFGYLKALAEYGLRMNGGHGCDSFRGRGSRLYIATGCKDVG
jgi:hypothetical protein